MRPLPSTPPLDPAAEVIAVALLRRTAAALLARDVDTFAGAFALPHRISTFERTVTLDTVADLHRTFFQVSDALIKLGVTDLVRDCIAAQFRNPDTIAHTYISHVIAGDRRVRDPYPCFSILTRKDGLWRVQSSDYALTDSPHARALTDTPAAPRVPPGPDPDPGLTQGNGA